MNERRRPRTERTKDPEEIGTAIARKMRADEATQRDEFQRVNNRARDREGRVRPGQQPARRPIRAASRRRQIPDTSIVCDSTGTPLQLPGKILRWVREKDHQDRATQARVAEFMAYGYEVLKDPHTGQPIRSHLGVAMAADPEDYADRVLDKLPGGALDPKGLYDPVHQLGEEANRAAGGEVVRVLDGNQTRRIEELDGCFVPHGDGGDEED